MNIQIYVTKKNPDVLKAERFFKERRIPYQIMDLKKHKLGQKEMDIFVRAIGAKELVDREGKKALERPVAHMSTESLIIAELLADIDDENELNAVYEQFMEVLFEDEEEEE